MPSLISPQVLWMKNYPRHPGLIFQFILSEFIPSYKEILHLEPLSQKIQSDLQGSFQEHLLPLKKSIYKLVGTPQSYIRPFPEQREEGILTKLRNYCLFYLQSRELEDLESLAMHRCMSKLWILSLHTIEAINFVETLKTKIPHLKCPLLNRSSLFKKVLRLRKSTQKIVLFMNHFARLLTRTLVRFREDENVIFFLLRHQRELDELYGPKYLYRLLLKMYPKGLAELSHFLTTKYANRGFHHLLPSIADKISELERVSS